MDRTAGSIDLPDRVYTNLAKMVHSVTGVSLADEERDDVCSSLQKRMRALNLSSYKEYCTYLSKSDSGGQELVHMLDAVSVRTTGFFHESHHFAFLAEEVMPALVAKKTRAGRSRRLRLWSVGCLSGEEAYALAMVVRDALRDISEWNVKILATDVSTKILHFARRGLYPEDKVRPVSAHMRSRSFTRERTGKGLFFRIRPEVRGLVTFRRLDLMADRFPFSGKFDVIFCRGVVTHFDRAGQEGLINRFYSLLHPGGHLLIGQGESLTPLKTAFQFVKPTIYVRPA